MRLTEGSFFSQGGSDGGQETKRSPHPRQVSAILLATRYVASPPRPQALLHSPGLLALCQSQRCGPSSLPAPPVSSSVRRRAGERARAARPLQLEPGRPPHRRQLGTGEVLAEFCLPWAFYLGTGELCSWCWGAWQGKHAC